VPGSRAFALAPAQDQRSDPRCEYNRAIWTGCGASPGEERLPDIFVSYSREDQAVARRYAEGFESQGFSVWWDQALTPGEAFDQVTERALEESRAVVVLWSKTSVNSRWVRAEATQANANGQLMPVMIEPCRRPIMFELTHTADLSQWQGELDDPAWQTLVAGVRRVVLKNTTGATGARAAAPIATAAAVVRELPPAPRPVPAARPPVASPAKVSEGGLPRRKVLLYGASAVGLFAAGLSGGALLRGGRDAEATDPPTFHRLTFRRGLIRSARFAPDGQTILYGALWDNELCRVYSTRTDNPESRPLELPNANLLAVSSSGDLAISLGAHMDGGTTYGTLARVPIAGGAPRELLEQVKFADWSPDGSQLAIIRNVGGIDQLEFPSGKVLLRPQGGEGTGLGFARVAADGRRVAFIHYAEPQTLRGRVCVIDASGKVEVLTDTYINVHGLAWRGEQIWYSASDDRPLFRSLFVVQPGAKPRLAMRPPVNVTVWDAAADGRLLIAQTDDRSAMIGHRQGEANDRDLSWLDASWVADVSRDGRMVLFREAGQGAGSPSAYLRGTDGSPAVNLGKGYPLSLSSDMRWVLVRRTAIAGDKSESFIDIVPTGAGDTTRLPGSNLNFSDARWLPDGRRIISRAAEPGRGMRLFQTLLPKGDPQPLTPEGIIGWMISPDGSMIATTGPEPGIRLYPVDGGAVRAGPGLGDNETLVGWIRDGLLVMRLADPVSPRGEVYLLDLATGRQRSWANILPRDSAGIMLMGSFSTTPDGGSLVYTWHRALSNLYIARGLV
jgi:eukaryotic-like serine/threonine-protein kinase